MTTTTDDYIPLSGGNNGALTAMDSGYKNSLPILVLITDGEITHSHTNKTRVNAYLVGESGGAYRLKNVKKAAAFAAHMRIRGQSTDSEQKAQYSFSLAEEPLEPFMGMPFGGKHWVLNDIGVQDHSLLRDPLAFYLQRQLGGVAGAIKNAKTGELNCWAPRHQYCQLFIYQKSAANNKTDAKILTDIIATPNLSSGGGFYRGLYLLLEKIHPQKSRVNIKVKDKPGDSPHKETGDLMFQINPASTFETIQGGSGNWYLQVKEFSSFSTEPVNLYEPKAHYFYGFNNQTTHNRQHSTYLNLINDWWNNWLTSSFTETCDYHSFAVYFLVNEVANDPDGYHKSTFMFKQGGKMYAGPLWDKDKSFGNPNNVFTGEDGWNYTRNNPPMWSALLSDSGFCRVVWDLWKDNALFFESKAKKKTVPPGWKNFLLEQQAILAKGNIVNDNGNLWGTPANTSDWDSQFSTLNTAVENRINWINNKLPELLKKSGFIPD